MKETIEMRKVFADYMEKAMEDNQKLMVIDADLAKANGTFDLRKKFPKRAIDVGIAEQNMASMAGGLSSYGFIPFISTFGPFATRRICDQIMISIAYAKQNVKILGTDPGISAEFNGGTHMPFEDIGVLRSIPDMVIYEATDSRELQKALPQIIDHYGPVYIRMVRKSCDLVHENDDFEFDLFKAEKMTEGSDVTICASGMMVRTALDAAEALKAEGINAEVLNFHTVKPLDKETLLESVKKTNCVVCAENHNVIGGLFSAVAETLVQEYPVKMEAVGVKDQFGEVGKIDYLRDRFNLNVEDIVKAAKKVIK